MIGRSGERGSGISVLAARHDDDDGTELRSVTLASIKPEISQALESLRDELPASHDSNVLHTALTIKRNQSPDRRRTVKPTKPICPLCKQVEVHLSTTSSAHIDTNLKTTNNTCL